MNKEVEELIETLKEYGDGFSNVLAPTEESVKALLDYINQLEKENEALLKQKNEAINYIKNSKKLGLRYHSEETLFKMQTIYRMLVGREEGGSNE